MTKEEQIWEESRRPRRFTPMREAVLLGLLIILFPLFNSFLGFDSAPHAVDTSEIPPFGEYAYVIINNNEPTFEINSLEAEPFEMYSELDYLGRCGYAMACVGKELMPTEPREDIGSVKPSGWVQAQYDFVEAKNLYNRCHLIGFQLTGENANERNLITGTRFLNVEGMLTYENMIADYVKETGNHVLYRVTPVYEGANLVASGVQVEGWSVEDCGQSICFNVYLYNVQPGVIIDYATGESWVDPNYPKE